MKKALPDLEAWAIFAKAAETGSFARAAEALSLSQATVSKAISRLEARVGATLFHRTSRRISLTGSGHAALDRAVRILEEGEALEAQAVEQSGSLRGRVQLAAPMSFGVARLGPVLGGFMRRYPEIELDIDLDDAVTDLVADRHDLAIRITAMADSSLRARRLCTVRILPVAAPAYLERAGRPKHPRDLADHRALVYTYSRNGTTWRFRHPRRGEFSLVAPAALRANNADLFMPVLREGVGLALQPEFLVWEDLQSGALETVLDDWQVPPIALHIDTPPGRRRPARVQALIDYLADRIAAAPWAEPPDD